MSESSVIVLPVPVGICVPIPCPTLLVKIVRYDLAHEQLMLQPATAGQQMVIHDTQQSQRRVHRG